MWCDSPVICEKEIEDITAEISVVTAKPNGGGLGQAQQKIGQVIARAGDGPSLRVEGAGGKAAEGEGAASVGVTPIVELDSAKLKATAKGMVVLNESEVVAEMTGLVASQGGVSVLQCRIVGVSNCRDSVIKRVW